jgi:2-oxo-4-hydroxy-4-carboxy--5-ureidoimidazoline (OHCU) decarboxylase
MESFEVEIRFNIGNTNYVARQHSTSTHVDIFQEEPYPMRRTWIGWLYCEANKSAAGLVEQIRVRINEAKPITERFKQS